VVPHKFNPAGAAANRPNVLLIVMDTVRADHLSLYGYERDTTPSLRKFAEKATQYTRAIAPADMTLPSHASIFTGIYGSRHKAHYDAPKSPEGRPLDEGFHTLSEILSEKGYLTMAVVANTAYLRHDFGLNQGFQYYDQRTAVPFLHETQPYYIRQGIRNGLTHFFSPPIFDQRYLRAEEINKEAFACLDKANLKRLPFFLLINYMDAHEPYIPPHPFDTYFSGKNPSFTLKNYFQMQEDVMRRERKVTDMEYRHLLSQYDGGIAYIDYHINELIERLKVVNLYDNTLIIITSDHGEVFGQRKIIGHASSVYQDQVYAPLIVKYPDLNKGLVEDELVSLVDLMPTALDVLGFGIPGEIQGESLLKVGEGNSRIVFSESFPNPMYIKWHSRFNRFERAIFSGNYKLISSTDGKRELYDLSKDPDEKGNFYETNDGISKELEAKLNQWLKEVKEESASPAKLRKETLDRLKSLGYIK
jgi:arylsulfatase A-like enzyme